MSFSAAQEIFWLTKDFPKDEMYSLTNQIRRASRYVPANIVEGWSKRTYENIFKRHPVDAFGSSHETILWLDFALNCKYINQEIYNIYFDKYYEINRMLTGLIDNWENYKK